MNSSQGIAESIRNLLADASLLVSQEVDLAKAEAEEKMEQLQVGLLSVASALVIALVALVVLAQALVAALANIMPPSVAALIVGVLLAGIAYLSMRKGLENLNPRKLAPRRTIRSVQQSAETIREAA